MRAAAGVLALIALAALAGSARAAVQPDPGGAAAWAGGLALLADPPGALALFDQPARLRPDGAARLSIGAARARPFGLDALARTRLAAGWTRARLAVALGVEAFGPAAARRTRAGLGAAWRVGDTSVGLAWHEARLEGSSGTARKSGALDAGLVLAGRPLALAFAARSLAAGGAAAARADPDWTIEARLDAAPARLHAALTHDLGGTRVGGGMAFAAGPCVVRAGAFGAPWSFAFGLSLGTARGRAAATFDAARSEHPALGPSDAWQGGIAW